MEKTENAAHPLQLFRFCPVCGGGRFTVNNFKSKKCPDCGFVYYFNPSSAVACFARDGRGNLLVAVRGVDPARGTYDLPGGFVDLWETAEEALARELLEETGLCAQDVRYLFSLPNDYLYSGFKVQTLDMFYECTMDDLGAARAADDVAELKILPLEELDPDMFGLDSVREAVRRYKKLD